MSTTSDECDVAGLADFNDIMDECDEALKDAAPIALVDTANSSENAGTSEEFFDTYPTAQGNEDCSEGPEEAVSFVPLDGSQLLALETLAGTARLRLRARLEGPLEEAVRHLVGLVAGREGGAGLWETLRCVGLFVDDLDCAVAAPALLTAAVKGRV
jgi:hypothetical protein